jgi:hypothetical protein
MLVPEMPEEPAVWQGPVVNFLFAAENGRIQQERIAHFMGQVCVDLMVQGLLTDLGELQAFLRKQFALVQLVAIPFHPESIAPRNLRCIDPATKEPKGHWLSALLDPNQTETTARLQALGMSRELNETILTRDTGMLAV